MTTRQAQKAEWLAREPELLSQIMKHGQHDLRAARQMVQELRAQHFQSLLQRKLQG